MSPKLLVQTLSVVAVLFLSGCAAENPGKIASTSSVPIIAPPAGVDESTCGLEGFVGDDSFAPIAGADVGIEGTEEVTRTAQDGRFTFSFLQPGKLSVVVSALGFETETRKVPCEAGSKITDLVFSLKELPKVGEQYVKVVQLVGRIGCAFGLVARTADACSNQDPNNPLKILPPIDRDAKATFYFTLDLGEITAAHYEMKWTRTGTFGSEFLVFNGLAIDQSGQHVQKRSCPGTAFLTNNPTTWNQVRGKSLLCATIISTLPEKPIATITPKEVSTVRVDPSDAFTPGGADESSKFVYQQKFDIYASFFYNGLAVADDYRVFEE